MKSSQIMNISLNVCVSLKLFKPNVKFYFNKVEAHIDCINLDFVKT